MWDKQLAGAIALLACLAFMLGCGSDASTSTPVIEGPPTLAAAEVEAEREGSPQFAALRWWQAVQLNKPELAASLYTHEPPLPDLAGQFNVLEGALAGLPKVEEVRRQGAHAVLVVDWNKREQRPHETKVQLRMVRVGGQWKLADNRLLNILLLEREKHDQAATP